MRFEFQIRYGHNELIAMPMTKTEKRRMVDDIRKKAIKLYIADLMTTRDVEAISKICEKYQRKLKGA
jgi:ribosomal 50S subunit-associated protein YjgA (DUF615 family)